MRLGYMRVSKSNGDQSLNLQRDALIGAGVHPDNIYSDMASGKNDDRPGLVACLKALREGDELIIWRLDRLGRNLTHLIETVNDLSERKIGFKCLTGVSIDTTTPTGRFVLTIFAGLSQFERELTRERVMAGLAAARVKSEALARPVCRARVMGYYFWIANGRSQKYRFRARAREGPAGEAACR